MNNNFKNVISNSHPTASVIMTYCVGKSTNPYANFRTHTKFQFSVNHEDNENDLKNENHPDNKNEGSLPSKQIHVQSQQ